MKGIYILLIEIGNTIKEKIGSHLFRIENLNTILEFGIKESRLAK